MTFHLKSLGKFRKDDPTQEGFLDDLMLLVVKWFLFIRIVELFGSRGYHISYVHKLFSNPGRLLLKTILFNLVEKTMSLYV